MVNNNKKFRIWDPYRGHKGLMLSNHTINTIGSTGLWKLLDDTGDLVLMEEKPYRDMCDNPIYELDIVQWIDPIGEWKLMDVVVNHKNPRFWLRSETDQEPISPEECKVVGNVFTTPDLLKEIIKPIDIQSLLNE